MIDYSTLFDSENIYDSVAIDKNGYHKRPWNGPDNSSDSDSSDCTEPMHEGIYIHALQYQTDGQGTIGHSARILFILDRSKYPEIFENDELQAPGEIAPSIYFGEAYPDDSDFYYDSTEHKVTKIGEENITTYGPGNSLYFEWYKDMSFYVNNYSTAFANVEEGTPVHAIIPVEANEGGTWNFIQLHTIFEGEETMAQGG